MPFAVIDRDQPEPTADVLTYGGFPVLGVFDRRRAARELQSVAPEHRDVIRVSDEIAADIRATMASARETDSDSGWYRWPVRDDRDDRRPTSEDT